MFFRVWRLSSKELDTYRLSRVFPPSKKRASPVCFIVLCLHDTEEHRVGAGWHAFTFITLMKKEIAIYFSQ